MARMLIITRRKRGKEEGREEDIKRKWESGQVK